MRDVFISWFLAVFLAIVAIVYLGRVLARGRSRHDRLESHGGSAFLNKGIMEMGYWLLDPLTDFLMRRGVTPNMVTGFSVIPGIGAGVAAGLGWFGLTCLLGTTAALADIVDGVLARRSGVESDAGETIDAAVDRYVESALGCGLAIYFRDNWVLMLFALAATIGGFMVSYTTAKAEAAGVAPPRGAMRRAERAVYLLFACELTGFTKAYASGWAAHAPIVAAMVLVGVVSNGSAVRRFAALVRAQRERESQNRNSTPIAS